MAIDLDELARSLGVAPPSSPLSEEGERNAAYLLGRIEELTEEEEPSSPFVLTPTRQSVLAKAAWAKDQAWPGRSGATDYQAYRAFLVAAYTANKTVVGMSQYQLAEVIGVSNRTAWNAIGRLERRGLIAIPNHGRCPECKEGTVTLRRPRRRCPFYGCNRYPECSYVEERDRTLALEYRLAEQEGERNYVTLVLDTYPLTAKSDATTLVPDAFRTRQGFPKGALPLLDHLEADNPQRPSELARRIRRHPSTVRHYLRELGQYKVALKVKGGWVKGNVDLTHVAEVLGTAGATERTRAYNETVRRPNLRRYLEHAKHNAQEGLPQAPIQARAGALVSEAGALGRDDGRAEIPERGTQPIPSTDGGRLSVEPVEELGPHPVDVLANHRARQSVGGMAMGNYAEERDAACEGCGNTLSFSAPDLRPYSCAYCKGKFVFADELAMAAA